MRINYRQLVATRLQLQGLCRPFQDPCSALQSMTAMQSQDLSMSIRALSLRSGCATANAVEQAFNAGHILRTHLLRPTWHLVMAKDLHWLLDLSADKILRQMRAHLKELELSPKVLSKARNIIQKRLEDLGSASREELMWALQSNGIATENNRGSLILMEAEMRRLLCSGPLVKRKQSYALIDQRAGKSTEGMTREEAMARLALRYYASHGPASVQDFSWWSGLNEGEASRASAAVSQQLQELRCKEDDTFYYCSKDSEIFDSAPRTTLLLPAYDELVIAYRDRQALVPANRQGHCISTNGIFYPLILHNAKVLGRWKSQSKAKSVGLQFEYFSGVLEDLSSAEQKRLAQALERCTAEYAAYHGLSVH